MFPTLFPGGPAAPRPPAFDHPGPFEGFGVVPTPAAFPLGAVLSIHVADVE
jgi:hypothetical protein